MAMDTRKSSSNAEPLIDEAILALCRKRPIQMFSDISQALPQHSWRTLFIALNRLAHQRRIELVPHRWDYEVISESLYSGRDIHHAATAPSGKISQSRQGV
jgi:hypothetical protein